MEGEKMLRLNLHMWSGKRKGFTRTKIILAIGIFVVIVGAGILSLAPGLFNTSNKAELDSENKSGVMTESIHETATEEKEPSVAVSEQEPADGIVAQEETVDSSGNINEMKKIRIRPKFDENEIVGLEVRWIQNDSLLGKLGVRRGDVLKSVNGTPMKNIGDLVNIIDSLVDGSRLEVEILRENATISLPNEVIQTGADPETTAEKKESSESITGKRLSIAPNEQEKFRIRPKFDGGYQAIGVEIWFLRNDSILAKLGLQKNDIIKSFNGKVVRDISEVADAILWGINSPRLDIEIIRNKEPMVVTYIAE